MDILHTVIQTVSIHVQKGGTVTNQEDIVECLRSFCADVTVSAATKTTVLRLTEESFDLSGEDTFLLLFYQTDSLVSSTWNRKVKLCLTLFSYESRRALPFSVCVLGCVLKWLFHYQIGLSFKLRGNYYFLFLEPFHSCPIHPN